MEVVRSNFISLLPEMRTAIREAWFVAIDFEFTGLFTSGGKCRDWDMLPQPSYRSAARGVSSFVPTQMGLSAFTWDDARNAFVAKTFNCYAFPDPEIRRRFVCDASTLMFLSRNNFDFNKFIAEGISFTTEAEEAMVKESCALASAPPSIATPIRRIFNWGNSGSSCDDRLELDTSSAEIQLLVLERVPEMFPNLDVKAAAGTNVTVSRKNHHDREELFKTYHHDKAVLKVGLSHLVREIQQANVPVIMHNGLFDTLYYLHHFVGSLPVDLAVFQQRLGNQFGKGTFYDTKLAFDSTPQFFPFSNQGLGDCYKLLLAKSAQHKIVHAEGYSRYQNQSGGFEHEAGFDAFMTASNFVRMAPFMPAYNRSSDVREIFPRAGQQDSLHVYSELKNKVRVGPGQSLDFSTAGSPLSTQTPAFKLPIPPAPPKPNSRRKRVSRRTSNTVHHRQGKEG